MCSFCILNFAFAECVSLYLYFFIQKQKQEMLIVCLNFYLLLCGAHASHGLTGLSGRGVKGVQTRQEDEFKAQLPLSKKSKMPPLTSYLSFSILAWSNLPEDQFLKHTVCFEKPNIVN